MNKKLIHRAIIAARMALLGLACVSIAIAENKPDELKQRILTQAQSMGPDDYAFTRTVKSEQTSNGKTEHHVNVEKFDPTKSGGARWTLVSVDGAPPSAEALGSSASSDTQHHEPRLPCDHLVALDCKGA